MKLFIFSFIVLFSNFNVYSQETKILQYNGTYVENSNSGFGGEAIYNYYENSNYERILNGKFVFTSGKRFTASGNFRKDKRIGEWKFMRKQQPYDKQVVEIEEASVKYDENGNLSGLATYRKYNEKTKKEIEKSTAFFKNNIIIGDYYFKSEKFTIELHLNDEGINDGTCKITYERNYLKYEDISKWNNGLLIWRLNRAISNGEIFIKYDGNAKYPEEYYTMEEASSFWDLQQAIVFWSTENIPYGNLGLLSTPNPMYVLIKYTPDITFEPFNLDKNNSQ